MDLAPGSATVSLVDNSHRFAVTAQDDGLRLPSALMDLDDQIRWYKHRRQVLKRRALQLRQNAQSLEQRAKQLERSEDE